MDIKKLSTGKNPPHEVNVVIEIPQGGNPIKYEIDKESGALVVDRFLHTAMYYPANYGFIPNTLSDDGDPCDALVIAQIPVISGAVVACRPIGVLKMKDESGGDEKIIMVPTEKLNSFYTGVTSYRDLPPILCEQIAHFFKHYKDLEKAKWVEITGWGDAEEARQYIMDGINRLKDSKAA
jgi:inorganic pyrophosphatase